MIAPKAAERGRGVTCACRVSGSNRSWQTSLSQCSCKLRHISMLVNQGSHVKQTSEKACFCLHPADSSCHPLWKCRDKAM